MAIPSGSNGWALGAPFPWAHENANIGATVVKASPGMLLFVVINTKGATGNTLTVYDAADGSTSNVVAVIDTTSALGAISYNLSLTNGLTYAMATGSAADVTIVYQ